MKNISSAYFLLLSGLSSLCFSQGIVNNGAQIVFSGASQIYISGGSAGDYLSQNGGIIQPSANGILTMEGDWTNNSANTGFGSDAGTVVFNGAAQSINGTNSTTFFNLTLQGSGTKVQNINTKVGGVSTTNGVLSLGTRPYNLNQFTLTITNPLAGGITSTGGYVISETNLAGNPSVLMWNMGTNTGAHVYPFGTVGGTQIPFTFNKTSAGAANISLATRPTAASDNLPWSTPVTSMFSPIVGGNGSIPVVIDRWWDIIASGAATGDATFSYLGSENTLTPPYNTGNLGAQNWNGGWLPSIGSTAAVLVGVGTAFAPAIGINAGSPASMPWVLSSVDAPLPIELKDLSLICFESNKAILKWQSVSEINGLRYDIMNSQDGTSFDKIDEVICQGKSNGANYSYTISQKEKYGKYYRVKMVDRDFSSKNSDVVFLNDNCMTNNTPQVYYNPGSGVIITSVSAEETDYRLSIIDAAGRLIENQSLPVHKGYNSYEINPALANGVYLVTLTYGNGQVIYKKIPVL